MKTLLAMVSPLLLVALAWLVGYALIVSINPDTPRQHSWTTAGTN